MLVSNELILQTLLGFRTELERINEAVNCLNDRACEPSVEPIYMSVTQAAERYSLGRDSIYEIIHLADSPDTLKVGSRRLLPIKEYDQFMKQHFQE